MVGCFRGPSTGSMLNSDKHLYDFGPFRLDLRERVLLREGIYVPLPPKTLDTLVVLIEHSGRIVEKGELIRLIWPDTFVEDVTLAKNVSMLRKVLGESEGCRYIDTIPKRGYRFVAEVRVLNPATPVTPSLPETTPAASRGPEAAAGAALPADTPARTAQKPEADRSRTRRVAAGAVVLMMAVAVFWLIRAPRPSGAYNFSEKAVPLTSFPGRQNQVAFSPDGNQ